MRNTCQYEWLSSLTENDIDFLKCYILNHGVVEDVAQDMGVSVQNIVILWNALSDKVKRSVENEGDRFCSYLLYLEKQKCISSDASLRIMQEYMRNKDEISRRGC